METFLIKAAQLVVALAFLVIIHEFGHYIIARAFGIKVEKFYLFFNPWFSLAKWKPKKKSIRFDKNGNEKKETRTVMRFHPALAPFKCAVLPLVKKLTPKAEEVYEMLSKKFMVDFDETGTIGKRYRRQDEIGTPFCVTVDFDTMSDNTVTVRDRDSMEQIRIGIDELERYVEDRIKFN